MSTPVTGAEAIVKKGVEEIGYAKGVRVGIDVDLVKEYQIGSRDPAVIRAGSKSFTVSIEKMYIDNAWGQDVLSGTPIEITVLPAGEGSGKPQITLSNVVLTGWELAVEAEGVVMESVSGEAESITFSTQT